MTTKQMTLPVQGMTCAACVATIERALGNLRGVGKVSVNLAGGKALLAKVDIIPVVTEEFSKLLLGPISARVRIPEGVIPDIRIAIERLWIPRPGHNGVGADEAPH